MLCSLFSSRGCNAEDWALVPRQFPAVTSLDLRRCKHASEALVRAVVQARTRCLLSLQCAAVAAAIQNDVG